VKGLGFWPINEFLMAQFVFVTHSPYDSRIFIIFIIKIWFEFSEFFLK
jgi:hypothetical protein